MPIAWRAAALFVAALTIRAAYRFASAPHRNPQHRRRVDGAGTIAMLAGLAIGSQAAAAFFRDWEEVERPASVTIVLAGAVPLTLVGVALKVGAARRPSIHVAGLRGWGTLRSIAHTGGSSTHGIPVHEIEMDDVEAPGVESFGASFSAEIPGRMAETLRVGDRVPVMVDPETKGVELDWIRSPSAARRDGFSDDEPTQPRPAPVAVSSGLPLATTSGPTPVSRTVLLVVIVVLLALVANVTSGLLGSDDDPVRRSPAASPPG